MKATKIFLPLLLSFVLVGGTAAIAGPAGTPPPPAPKVCPDCDNPGCPMFDGPHFARPEMNPPRPHHFLKSLSPEDRAKFKEMMDGITTKRNGLKDEIFVKLAQLRALQNASTPDLKAVTETAQQIVGLHNQLRVLKKEQKEKTKEFMKNHMPKHPAPADK